MAARDGLQAMDRIIGMLPPEATASVDAPLRDDGIWHLDVTLRGIREVVEYHPGRGYGLYSNIAPGYGEMPDIMEADPATAIRRLVEIIASQGPGNAGTAVSP